MRKKNKQKNHSYSPAVKGKLDVAPHGMGFVSVPGMALDIKIQKENLKNAMTGDIVEVNIYKIGKTSKRPEGVISRIIERGQTECIGTVEKVSNFAFVIPDNKNIRKDIFLNETESKDLQTGDRVIVKILHWDEKSKNPIGKVIDVLTANKENDIAMQEILLQKGFNLQFPKEVLDETTQLILEISDEVINNRKDLRNILTFTIDPHDAKDFDDAISFEKINEDIYRIGVHIADVSHYVKPNTALDKEAYKRATSVYLPDRVLPMLPEKISNELCSLRPHEDKLTFSVIFDIHKNTEIQKQWFGKTIIHSDHRYTYENVQQIIETKTGIHSDIILELNALTQKIREEKYKKGAINFTSEEAKFILDENGIPESVIIKESKEAHQLIEELMLLANKAVATFVAEIKDKKIYFPYRVHDTPDIEKLKPFVDFAVQFGYSFDLTTPHTIAQSFNNMLKKSAEIPEQIILHTLGIRTMAKAIYTTENIGHYGLAFENYCHFTSPIRRYPDVIVHRILHDLLQNKYVPNKELEKACVHCSEKERSAMEAEREGTRYKQVEFMSKHLGEVLEATVSGVAAHGFWALTIEQKCEGFVHLHNMPEKEAFQFVESEYALISKNKKHKIQIGMKVKVQVVNANLEKRQVDFEYIQS